MAVDLEYRLSGGAANSDPILSIGGAMSSVEATGSTLFDTVSSAEAAAGDTEYRCVYIYNNGATEATSISLWIYAQTPSADTTIAIALGGEGEGGTAETPANENTAPSGETFSSPSSAGAGLSVGNLANGERYPIWIRRTVSAAAAGVSSDTFTLRCTYDYIP